MFMYFEPLNTNFEVGHSFEGTEKVIKNNWLNIRKTVFRKIKKSIALFDTV